MTLRDELPADVVGQMEKLRQSLDNSSAQPSEEQLATAYRALEGAGGTVIYPDGSSEPINIANCRGGRTILRELAAETKHIEFAAELKADEDEEEGVFEGLASTFGNVDLVGDIIKRGAFKGSLADRPAEKVKMLLGHDAGGIPIGVWDSIKETRQGLSVKGRLLLKIQQAADVFEAMKAGVMDSLSIGFRTLEEDFDKQGRRIIKAVDLLEISVVNFPANPKAQITSVKDFLQRVGPEDIACKRDLENVLRDAGFSKSLAGYIVAGWEPPARRDAEGNELAAAIENLIRTIRPAA
jgi:uncharacterized protein